MKRKIVVVEDDIDTAEAIGHLIHHLGHEAIAINSTVGFHNIAQYAPGLIILDDWLPDDIGVRLYQQLKNDPGTERIPMLLLSTNPRIEQRCAFWGADDFLEMPFEIDDLFQIINRRLENSANLS